MPKHRSRKASRKAAAPRQPADRLRIRWLSRFQDFSDLCALQSQDTRNRSWWSAMSTRLLAGYLRIGRRSSPPSRQRCTMCRLPSIDSKANQYWGSEEVGQIERDSQHGHESDGPPETDPESQKAHDHIKDIRNVRIVMIAMNTMARDIIRTNASRMASSDS